MLVLGEKDEEVPQSFVDSLLGVKSAAGKPAVATARQRLSRPPPEPARPTGRSWPRPAKKPGAGVGRGPDGLKGTGPAGKITEADIQKAAEAKPAGPATAAAAPAAAAGEARLEPPSL